MDLVRLSAAFAVLISHSFPVTVGTNVGIEPLHRITGGQITIGLFSVLIFFVASGYLIAQSADRTPRLDDFILKRLLRIMPGLLIVVVLATVVLGPLVTTLPATSYFSSRETWSYLRLAFFLPDRGSLPGVFPHNPVPLAVNGSLWTLRWEVLCYIVLGVTAMLARSRKLRIHLAIALCASILAQMSGGIHWPLFYLLGFFFTGSAFYGFRECIRFSRMWLCLATALLLTALVSGWFAILGPIPLTYLVLFASNSLKAPRWLEKVDYSYGIYLYAFPAQQTIEMLSPGPWWHNAFLAVPVTLACAIASWHLVEHPAIIIRQRWRAGASSLPVSPNARVETQS
jgi:peptidoglycan/LPS O-acetylase OafA/YrhL